MDGGTKSVNKGVKRGASESAKESRSKTRATKMMQAPFMAAIIRLSRTKNITRDQTLRGLVPIDLIMKGLIVRDVIMIDLIIRDLMMGSITRTTLMLMWKISRGSTTRWPA